MSEAPVGGAEHAHRARSFHRLAQRPQGTCHGRLRGDGQLYLRPLAFRLLEAGVSLRLVSSVALARTRDALHNGWDKNDPKDAQVILHMLKIGATQTYADPLLTGINDIQELTRDDSYLIVRSQHR